MRTQRNSWAAQFQESFLWSDSNCMDLSSLTLGGYKEVQYLWTKSGLFPIYTRKGNINCHIQFWKVTSLVESFKNINRKKMHISFQNTLLVDHYFLLDRILHGSKWTSADSYRTDICYLTNCSKTEFFADFIFTIIICAIINTNKRNHS